MADDPNGVLKFPLLALKVLGRHPKMNPVLDKVTAALYLITLVYLSVVTLLQYSNIGRDVYKFANNFEGSTAYLQMGGKVIFTITHKDKIIELLDEIKHFWRVEKCVGSAREELKTMLTRTRIILKVFFVCITATEILIVIAPLFTKDIAVGAWTLEGHDTLFTFTLIVQEVVLFFVFTTFTFIVDCVFLVLFIYVIIQFRILNYCFRNMKALKGPNSKTYSDSLKVYVQYHDFMLSYLKKLKDTVSPVMLIEYATTAVLFCTEMYMFIESNSVQESIRRPVSFCAVLFQLSFYCIPADYIAAEASAVSDAMYESDWVSGYLPSARRTMNFVIQRAQKTFTFTAGGLVDINTRTLINVVKISWSVCTILRAVKIRNQII